MVSKGNESKMDINQALVDALRNLLIENSIENIKVIDICKESGIPRSTFYYHFNDKYELLEYAIKSISTKVANEVVNNNPSNFKEYASNLEKIIVNFFNDNKELCYLIYSKNVNSRTFEILNDIICDNIKERLYDEEKKGFHFKYPVEFTAEFYVGGVSRLCKFWVRNFGKYSVEDYLNYLNELSNHLFM